MMGNRWFCSSPNREPYCPGDEGCAGHIKAAPTSHIVGMDVSIGPLRRQRCAWCGHLLVDEDLSRMSWPLNPDGTDPGPPGLWPIGAVLAVDGPVQYVVDEDDWPESEIYPGEKRLPDGCCARLDPYVTQ